jgi:hypothetical protein
MRLVVESEDRSASGGESLLAVEESEKAAVIDPVRALRLMGTAGMPRSVRKRGPVVSTTGAG